MKGLGLFGSMGESAKELESESERQREKGGGEKERGIEIGQNYTGHSF